MGKRQKGSVTQHQTLPHPPGSAQATRVGVRRAGLPNSPGFSLSKTAALDLLSGSQTGATKVWASESDYCYLKMARGDQTFTPKWPHRTTINQIVFSSRVSFQKELCVISESREINDYLKSIINFIDYTSQNTGRGGKQQRRRPGWGQIQDLQDSGALASTQAPSPPSWQIFILCPRTP